MTAPGPDEVDYAVPAAVVSSRRRTGRREVGPLWDGPARRRLKVGCWVGAGLLSVPLLLPLVVPPETGAETPEAAVTQLLQGIADVDPVSVLDVVDPVETDDPARADAAYDRLASRLLRIGEQVPPDVTAVLLDVERQVGGAVDRDAIATLAAVEMDLEALSLRSDDTAGDQVRVLIDGGVLGFEIDPGRLPDDATGLSRASYDMPLAEGWRRDGEPFAPYLVTVERDGRWYVSLEATASDLLDLPR